MATIIDNTVLAKIKSSWNQWIKNSVEFCAISENDIQVITSFTDYFDDGILFDIISKPNERNIRDSESLIFLQPAALYNLNHIFTPGLPGLALWGRSYKSSCIILFFPYININYTN